MKHSFKWLIVLASLAVACQVICDEFDPNEFVIKKERLLSGTNTAERVWFVTTNLLSRQPRWDGKNADVPLSKSNAIAIVLVEVKHQYKEIDAFKVQSVSLWNLSWNKELKPYGCCSNVWYYFISTEPIDPRITVELTDSMNGWGLDQIVLLDGTIVKYRLKPKEKPRQ